MHPLHPYVSRAIAEQRVAGWIAAADRSRIARAHRERDRELRRLSAVADARPVARTAERRDSHPVRPVAVTRAVAVDCRDDDLARHDATVGSDSAPFCAVGR
jgi:hypothetical protein